MLRARKTEIKAEAFVATYIRSNCNGTRAMKELGHPGDDNVLGNAASRMLRNAKVQELFAQTLQHLEASREESIARISDFSRADIDYFLDERGCFDLAKARRAGKTHLLKELRIETKHRTVGEEEVVEVRWTTIRLHDALAATATMMKYHGLLRDRVELDPSTSMAAMLERVLLRSQRTHTG